MLMTAMMTQTAPTQKDPSTARVSMDIPEMGSLASVCPQLTSKELLAKFNSLIFICPRDFWVISIVLFLDVNECDPDGISDIYKYLVHNCHNDSNCTNAKGSFHCTCLVGYTGDGVRCEGETTGMEYFAATV